MSIKERNYLIYLFMQTIYLKKSFFAAILALFVFTAIAFYVLPVVTSTVNTADACCGTGPDPVDPPDDGGGDDGGTPVTPPTCDIVTSLRFVDPGQTYRITWTGNANATYRLVNDTTSLPVDPSGWYEFVWDADDAMVMYEIRGTNAGGTCSDIVEVYRTVEAPTCDITSNITAVVDGGQFTISWVGTPNHSTAFRVNGTLVDAVDSATYTFPVGRTTPIVFTMTGDNAAGDCSDVVTVYPESHQPAPTCDRFDAAPSTITAGGSSVLSWDTTNATEVKIQRPAGPQIVALDGNLTVTPGSTYTFVLTATGPGGTDTCSKTVTVNPVTPTAPVCDLIASYSSLTVGQSVRLTWTSSNTSGNATINPGNMTVDPRSTTDYRDVSPTVTTTYVMSVQNSAGDTATCSETITVNPVTPVFSCANNVDFRASDTSIDEGDNTTLTWDTTGVTSLSINNGVSSTALDGSEVVSPNSDTTYTLTASNGKDTISCPLTISVDEDNGGGGGGSSSPRCELDISEDEIKRGERVTLKWETSNATEVILKDNHGKTLMTTEDKISSDKKELYDGEMTLSPQEDTTYTLIAERGSKDKECEVEVEVEGITVITDNDQDEVVTGITITQLPYTGFEAGPFLTMVFYGLLLLWALYLAYVLVIRRNHLTPATNVAAPKATVTYMDDKVASGMFVETMSQAPRFVEAAPVANETATAVATPVVGYASLTRDTEYDAAATMVENEAHRAQVLFSSEAMRQFVDATNSENRLSSLQAILAAAQASYPREDGWVVVTGERMSELCAACATPVATTVASFTPASVTAGNSSLAEAIVTGNIVAAYQMIGHRPMIAVADAAADLDALYRAKQGDATATVSEVLATAVVTEAQIAGAIAALTGALDGTYTDEAAAVKMAILKAVQAIHG